MMAYDRAEAEGMFNLSDYKVGLATVNLRFAEQYAEGEIRAADIVAADESLARELAERPRQQAIARVARGIGRAAIATPLR